MGRVKVILDMPVGHWKRKCAQLCRQLSEGCVNRTKNSLNLELHVGMLYVPERHLAVGEVVQDAAEAPDVAFGADLDAHLPVLWRAAGRVLNGFGGHEVEGSHLGVLHDASLVGLDGAGNTCKM